MADEKLGLIVIEKNIPIPTHRHGSVFSKLDVGDSFLCEDRKKGAARIAYYNRKLKPKRFIGRTMPDGYRIWRVEDED